MPQPDRETRRIAAFIGARVFVDEGRYSTDSSLIYELVELGQRFDEFFLHCFLIEDGRARDELRMPPNVRLVDLGRVTCGRDLYAHPLRLWRRVTASVRRGSWSAAVLDEPGLVSLLALAACWLAGRPAIALIRGDPAAGEVAYRHSRGIGAVTGQILRRFRMLVCWALARTVPVVTDSDIVASRLRQRGAQVRRVAAASVAEDEVLPAGEPWRGASSGPLRALFVGRLDPVKDVETLLDAVGRACGAGRPVTLRIIGAGDPEYTDLLRSRVHGLGLADVVEFTGPVPHGPDLYRYYQRAHVLMLSSRSEGMPKVVVEAMAHGLPVIATAVGGLPGLVTPDVGILVPARDGAALSEALGRIHDSPALARGMGEAARRAAAGLLAGAVSRQLAEVAAIASRPRARLRRRAPGDTNCPRNAVSGARLTVAVPTRNRLPLLREALRSVLAQSFTDWEILVVDDGSTDGTWPWLCSIADARVRVCRTDRPAERSAARNRALALARAPHILFLDDDDRLAPGALGFLMAGVAAAPDAVAVIGRRVLFDAKGNRRAARHPRRPQLRWAWKDVMAGWASGVGATLYRADIVRAVGGWDESLNLAEDQDLLLRVSSQGPVRLVPGVTLEQRLHRAQRRSEDTVKIERAVRESFLARLDSPHRRSGGRLLRSWEAGRAGDAALADQRCRRALCCYIRGLWICPALLASPLVGPRLAAQSAKAVAGSCLGRRGADLARAAKARTRLLLRRAPGEGEIPDQVPAPAALPLAIRPYEPSPDGHSPWAAGLRILLPGSVANLAVQAVLLILALFTGIVTARVLGPAQRGELSFLVLVPSMLTVIGSLGAEYGVYYLWHEEQGRLRPPLLAAGAVVTLLSGALCAAAGFLVVSWFEPRAGLPVRLLVAISMPLSIANVILTMALMADRRLAGYNASRLAGPVMYTCVIAVLWAAGTLDVAFAFLAWVISLVLTVAVDVAMVLRRSNGMLRWQSAVARRSLAYGLRSYVGVVAQFGTLRLDQAMLVGLAGNGALGLYYAAVSLGETVLQLANNVGSAMMAHLGGRSRAQQRHLALVTMVVVGVGTAAAAALLMAFGGGVITLLLGRAYLPGLSALRILLPGLVFLAVARVMNGYFIAVGEAAVFARAAVVSLAVTVAGNVALIPSLQARGAALASTVSYGMLALWLAMVFRADRDVVSPPSTPVVPGQGYDAGPA